MGSVLKGNSYRLVDNRSFELPLPLKYELLKEDSPIAVYEVSKDEKVTCRIITKYKENMITPIYRPLDISDIYYFFSCRVFQDRTPFTMTELSLLGLDKYNVYDIIRRTRGVTPFDTYWLRFDGDTCDYESARNAWDSLMRQVGAPAAQKAPEMSEPSAPSATSAPESDADVGEILNQHKIDVAAKFAANEEISKEDLAESVPVTNNTMSADEIEALLMKSGLTDLSQPEPEPEPETKSSGGMMSEDEIAALLAATSAPEPEAPAEPEPETKSSGGMMSEDEIAAMLAAASAPEPEAPAEPEPAPVEEKPASGGKMSQEDIDAMLAAAAAPEPEAPAEPEPAPVEEKPASSGKMSQEDIEAMLAATAAPEPEVPAEPEPAPVEEKPAGGGKMSQEDIEAMLAAASGAVDNATGDAAEAVQETLEEAAPEEKPAGGKMSEAEIEALLNGMQEDAST